MKGGSLRSASLAGGFVALVLALAGAGSAAAATITVANANDSGAGSLRQAIAEASPGETIVLPASASHYAVTSAELVIAKSLTITGAGARSTVIDAMGSAHRVLEVTAGTVTISGVTITGAHEALEDAGGIEIEGSSDVTLENVSVSGNTVKESDGYDAGAIETSHDSTLTIEASTIASNVGYNGGALWIGGTAVITDSTIVGNRGGSRTSNGDAGAIDNGGGSITLLNDTIAGNECFNGPGCGGAILGAATAKNTIIAENLAGSEHSEEVVTSNCSGAITSTGPNLENGSECDFAAHGGLSSTNPMLGPLANNGGETETEAPLAGSPAIDAGTNTGCPTTDQRGVARPQGATCDIGAYELAPPSALTSSASAVGPTTATLAGTASNPDVLAGTVHFQWGTTTAYGSETVGQSLAETTSAQAIAAAVTGLPPSTVIHFREVAVNPDGTAFGADQTFTTLPPPAVAPTPAPTITAARLTNKRFRVAKQATAISARKAPLGTSFRFTLSAAAKLQIAITRSAAGLRHGRSCLAPSAKLKRAHAKHCTRTLTLGTLTRLSELEGAGSVPFSGRIGHRALSAGGYNAVLLASDAGGRSKPVTLSFVIVG
jgi:hypothetical protein